MALPWVIHFLLQSESCPGSCQTHPGAFPVRPCTRPARWQGPLLHAGTPRPALIAAIHPSGTAQPGGLCPPRALCPLLTWRRALVRVLSVCLSHGHSPLRPQLHTGHTTDSQVAQSRLPTLPRAQGPRPGPGNPSNRDCLSRSWPPREPGILTGSQRCCPQGPGAEGKGGVLKAGLACFQGGETKPAGTWCPRGCRGHDTLAGRTAWGRRAGPAGSVQTDWD